MDELAKRFRLGCAGKEIFEIKPVILGGNPTDPGNKVVLDRQEHIKAVVHWNRVVRDLRAKRRVVDES
jgi:hypothetical protein